MQGSKTWSTSVPETSGALTIPALRSPISRPLPGREARPSAPSRSRCAATALPRPARSRGAAAHAAYGRPDAAQRSRPAARCCRSGRALLIALGLALRWTPPSPAAALVGAAGAAPAARPRHTVRRALGSWSRRGGGLSGAGGGHDRADAARRLGPEENGAPPPASASAPYARSCSRCSSSVTPAARRLFREDRRGGRPCRRRRAEVGVIPARAWRCSRRPAVSVSPPARARGRPPPPPTASARPASWCAPAMR
jgi:hypothetical protein